MRPRLRRGQQHEGSGPWLEQSAEIRELSVNFTPLEAMSD